MASKTKTTTIATPSYVDFEPYCEWKKEEEAETLILHLPDFKKDQLKVQVNNLGVLKVSGERSVTTDKTKRSRFLKETKIPQGCDINDIRAKFSGGHLFVTMPKKAPPKAEQQQQKPETISSGAPKSDVTQKTKEEDLAPNNDKLKATNYDQTKDDQIKDDHTFGLGSSLGRLQVQKKVTLSLGVAIAAMVAIGAYVAYQYGSSSSPPSHIEE